MATGYGLQSKITSVDSILLVHPCKYYLFDTSMDLVGPLFEGAKQAYGRDKKFIEDVTSAFEKTKKKFEELGQRFDASRIYVIADSHPTFVEFGNLICGSKNIYEILSEKDARELLKQGTNIMLGGGYWGDCHALAFNELVLGFLYSEAASENKLRILAPANYIFNGPNTIDEVFEREGKEAFLNAFPRDYLNGRYSKQDFQKKTAPFSYTFSFDGEVIVEHKTNSKKEFSLEVLSSI